MKPHSESGQRSVGNCSTKISTTSLSTTSPVNGRRRIAAGQPKDPSWAAPPDQKGVAFDGWGDTNGRAAHLASK